MKSRKLEKILLMSCRSPYIDDEKIYPPLGILYLKSVVEKNTDISVDLKDNYELKPETFEDYDLIGISIMTPQREEALKILDTVKSNFPEKIVVGGGPHAKHYLEDVVKQPYDFIVTDDGQRSLLKILYGKASRVERDKMSKLEWGNMPRPDRSSQEAREFLATYHYTLQGRKAGTMLTATGCTEQCKFCEDAMTRVRWSPLDKLEDEMDDLKNLGYKGVYLFDDLFAIAMPQVKPICEQLQKRDLIYRCNGQARYFTKWEEDFAKLLGDTGCVEIAFGHETGSQKILDGINKRTTIEQNYKSVEFAKKHGINVKSFMLLGLPGEDWETLRDTERFIATAGMDDFQCAIYYPYKGTQLRDAIDRGQADFDLMFQGEGLGAYGQKGGNTESVVRTSKLSSEDLLRFRDYLVDRYKPKSHKEHWKDEDKFRDTHLKSQVEYG